MADGIRRVAILIRREVGYGGAMLRGIAQFARSSEPWLVHTPLGGTMSLMKLLAAWRPSGVIAEWWDERTTRRLKELGVPIVDVSPWPRIPGVCYVGLEQEKIGRLVAEHFIERGIRHFAYFGLDDRRCHQQEQGFGQALKEVGASFVSLYADHIPRFNAHNAWAAADSYLVGWIKSLPRPVGIMLFDDEVAMWATQACLAARLRVPEDVAIVGVFNNEVNCEFAHPPISSVEVPAMRVGYEAARILHAKMAGEPLESEKVLLPPVGVALRQSSDLVAIEDAEVAAAIRYIRNHPTGALKVSDVLRRLAVSRRSLEIRFHRVLGRTIHEEITRVRMDRARQLLIGTDWSMPHIADACGYAFASQFSNAFKREMGISPVAFRNQFRYRKPKED